jgi:pyruvate dehydrogenase E2 component (dihydrolipoamide acetyltransferase)
MATIELKVPDIGDFADVEVIELLVKPGDTVKPEQSLLTVESDKASMEIPSSDGGRIVELLVKLGDRVKEGSVIALIEADASANAAAASAAPAAPVAPAAPNVVSVPPVPEAAPTPTAAQAAVPAPSGGTLVVEVPDIGDFKDVEVIELMVKPGDTVAPEQSLITVESDKASMEIPSSAGGVVVELKVKVGERFNRFRFALQ